MNEWYLSNMSKITKTQFFTGKWGSCKLRVVVIAAIFLANIINFRGRDLNDFIYSIKGFLFLEQTADISSSSRHKNQSLQLPLIYYCPVSPI